MAAPTGSSRRRQTVDAIMQAYNEEGSVDKVISYRSDDCIHEILPQSLGVPPATNEVFRKQFSVVRSKLRNFKVTVNEIIEDEKANKVVVWAQSTADADVGPYANEYMLVFYFNETGDKVVRFLEWVDSAFSKDFFGKLGGYKAQ